MAGATAAEAIAAWNRRAPSSELLALRAAISEIDSASSGSFSNDEAKRALSAIHVRARALQSHSTDRRDGVGNDNDGREDSQP